MRFLCLLITAWVSFLPLDIYGQSRALVFQSDFGLKDGAVSAMKGVVYGVSPNINMFDITHEIPAYDIWEAAYRLFQTASYWPQGTVFVSVVDPGVGSERKSVVLKTKTGHFFVSPDNGTLTLVAEHLGISEVRLIDETINRLKNSDSSYTFHGRDVYAFTGARLAAGAITFEKVGKALPKQVVQIPYQKAIFENGIVKGNIPVLDVQYGNIWSNIDRKTFAKLNVRTGEKLHVKVYHDGEIVFDDTVALANTFADVKVGENLGYMNSLMNFSLGINQESFSQKYKVGSGARWTIHVQKAD